MNTELQRALTYLSDHPYPKDEDKYRKACETVGDYRHELTYRVFIRLPGDRGKPAGLEWNRVRKHSVAIRGYDHERIYEPIKPRTEFVISAADPVVMRPGDIVYIRPIGAPRSAAYDRFGIVELDGGQGFGWRIKPDPFTTSTAYSSMFSTKEFPLHQLAEMTLGRNTPLCLNVSFHGGVLVPVVAVQAVDVQAGIVTLLLDEAVEVFDPETGPNY